MTNYVDTGLAQVTEYCYTVSAYNATTESDQSAETACATTLDIYLEEPQNLTAEENGLEVSLDWETPPSAIGVGDECVTDYGDPGYIDCYGYCFSEVYLGWSGAGFCDGPGAEVPFNCDGSCEYSYDCAEVCGGTDISCWTIEEDVVGEWMMVAIFILMIITFIITVILTCRHKVAMQVKVH